MLVSARRDAEAAWQFFTRALRTPKVVPSEVVTDAAPVYPAALDDELPRRSTSSSIGDQVTTVIDNQLDVACRTVQLSDG